MFYFTVTKLDLGKAGVDFLCLAGLCILMLIYKCQCLPLHTPLRPIKIHLLINKILVVPSVKVNKDLKKLEYSVSILKEELSSGAETAPQNRRGMDLLFFRRGGLLWPWEKHAVFTQTNLV